MTNLLEKARLKIHYKYINKEASEGGGDVTMRNELIRLRTRTGAQVLMHTSKDLIYTAITATDCWIEMSAMVNLMYMPKIVCFHRK